MCLRILSFSLLLTFSFSANAYQDSCGFLKKIIYEKRSLSSKEKKLNFYSDFINSGYTSFNGNKTIESFVEYLDSNIIRQCGYGYKSKEIKYEVKYHLRSLARSGVDFSDIVKDELLAKSEPTISTVKNENLITADSVPNNQLVDSKNKSREPATFINTAISGGTGDKCKIVGDIIYEDLSGKSVDYRNALSRQLMTSMGRVPDNIHTLGNRDYLGDVYSECNHPKGNDVENFIIQASTDWSKLNYSKVDDYFIIKEETISSLGVCDLYKKLAETDDRDILALSFNRIIDSDEFTKVKNSNNDVLSNFIFNRSLPKCNLGTMEAKVKRIFNAYLDGFNIDFKYKNPPSLLLLDDSYENMLTGLSAFHIQPPFLGESPESKIKKLEEKKARALQEYSRPVEIDEIGIDRAFQNYSKEVADHNKRFDQLMRNNEKSRKQYEAILNNCELPRFFGQFKSVDLASPVVKDTESFLYYAMVGICQEDFVLTADSLTLPYNMLYSRIDFVEIDGVLTSPSVNKGNGIAKNSLNNHSNEIFAYYYNKFVLPSMKRRDQLTRERYREKFIASRYPSKTKPDIDSIDREIAELRATKPAKSAPNDEIYRFVAANNHIYDLIKEGKYFYKCENRICSPYMAVKGSAFRLNSIFNTNHIINKYYN